MKKIRLNTFETNSSSTHSIILCSKDEYNKLLSHEYFLDGWDNYKILTHDDVDEIMIKDMTLYPEDYKKCKNKEDCLRVLLGKNDKVITIDTFHTMAHDDGLDTFTEYYTSKSGDEIVAFGHYGYDG